MVNTNPDSSPALAGGQACFELGRPMPAQHRHDTGQSDRAAAALGLRLSEPQLETGSFERLAHRQHPGLQIDVLPAQPDGFTLPQPQSDRDGDETFEPVARDGRQQHTRLRGPQGLDPPGTMPGRVGQRGNVARDQLPSKGQIQRRAQQHIARPPSHAGGARRLHADTLRHCGARVWRAGCAQAGQHTVAHNLFVALLGALPDSALLDEPAANDGSTQKQHGCRGADTGIQEGITHATVNSSAPRGGPKAIAHIQGLMLVPAVLPLGAAHSQSSQTSGKLLRQRLRRTRSRHCGVSGKGVQSAGEPPGLRSPPAISHPQRAHRMKAQTQTIGQLARVLNVDERKVSRTARRVLGLITTMVRDPTLGLSRNHCRQIAQALGKPDLWGPASRPFARAPRADPGLRRAAPQERQVRDRRGRRSRSSSWRLSGPARRPVFSRPKACPRSRTRPAPGALSDGGSWTSRTGRSPPTPGGD